MVDKHCVATTPLVSVARRWYQLVMPTSLLLLLLLLLCLFNEGVHVIYNKKNSDKCDGFLLQWFSHGPHMAWQ